jgi:hypothetical protein
VARKYEQAKAPRFRTERGSFGEQIRVPARLQFFPLIFLPFWLLIWTFAGIAALVEFLRTGEGFLALWLVFWAAGWLFAAGSLCWMISGAEIIRVTSGDLEIGESLFGWTRGRLYRGSEIRNLAAAESPPFFAQFQPHLPFVMKPRSGSVKFSYGARTVYAGQGLDEAEGRLIAEWLRSRLPRDASHSAFTDRGSAGSNF